MKKADGFEYFREMIHGIPVLNSKITTCEVADRLKRPMGEYVTIQTGKLRELVDFEPAIECLAECLRRKLEAFRGKRLLIVGVGNERLSVDSLGPKAARSIPVHFMSAANAACMFESAAVFVPGAPVQTNINTTKLVSGAARTMGADCAILIDTSGIANFEDVAANIFITNSGLKICRGEETLSQESLGIPVVAVSAPLVWKLPAKIAAMYRLGDGKGDVDLTKADVELDLKPSVAIIAYGIMRALYPEVDLDSLRRIVEVL